MKKITAAEAEAYTLFAEGNSEQKDCLHKKWKVQNKHKVKDIHSPSPISHSCNLIAPIFFVLELQTQAVIFPPSLVKTVIFTLEDVNVYRDSASDSSTSFISSNLSCLTVSSSPVFSFVSLVFKQTIRSNQSPYFSLMFTFHAVLILSLSSPFYSLFFIFCMAASKQHYRFTPKFIIHCVSLVIKNVLSPFLQRILEGGSLLDVPQFGCLPVKCIRLSFIFYFCSK